MNNDKVSQALVWITDILKSEQIPYAITGGLAAYAYGSKRAIVDIDIDAPSDKLEHLQALVQEYVKEPLYFCDDDDYKGPILVLEYKGQIIELGSLEPEIYDKQNEKWIHSGTNLDEIEMRDLFGHQYPIISKQELIAYKKIMARDVDIQDIEALDT